MVGARRASHGPGATLRAARGLGPATGVPRLPATAAFRAACRGAGFGGRPGRSRFLRRRSPGRGATRGRPHPAAAAGDAPLTASRSRRSALELDDPAARRVLGRGHPRLAHSCSTCCCTPARTHLRIHQPAVGATELRRQGHRHRLPGGIDPQVEERAPTPPGPPDTFGHCPNRTKACVAMTAARQALWLRTHQRARQRLRPLCSRPAPKAGIRSQDMPSARTARATARHPHPLVRPAEPWPASKQQPGNGLPGRELLHARAISPAECSRPANRAAPAACTHTSRAPARRSARARR